MDKKYLDFKLVPVGTDKKTETYFVYPKDQPMKIAEIKWYAPWRRYCFYPEPNTLWDAACLSEVYSLITQKMIDRKVASQNTRQRNR